MSALRHRVLEFLVDPDPSAGGSPRNRTARATALEPPTAGVLGALQDALPVATLLSAELRLRCSASCVLLADWSAGERPVNRTSPASRPARRLAERLGARGIDACPKGRTVIVRLPAEPAAAASACRRAVAAADCPSVLALMGPRPGPLDALVDELGLVLLVLGPTASPELGELALANVAEPRALVVRRPPVSAGLARLLASSSIATSRLLGTDVVQAVRAVA